MNMENKKKKKGFTLIELVIVLAVLAIIALIAIPNFTKVRNDSLTKADAQTMDQIEKIVKMGIANEEIKVPSTGQLEFVIKDSAIAPTSGVELTFADMVKDVKNPQVNGKNNGFEVIVTTSSDVTVDYK